MKFFSLLLTTSFEDWTAKTNKRKKEREKIKKRCPESNIFPFFEPQKKKKKKRHQYEQIDKPL